MYYHDQFYHSDSYLSEYNRDYISMTKRYNSMYQRPATIYIHNQSRQQLSLYEEKHVHGTVRQQPPSSIRPGQTVSFSVSESSGASIGPEGYVSYIITTGGDYCCKMEFHYHHPYGHSQSSYWAVANDSYPVRISVDNPHPGGHSQTVNFYVKDK